MAGAEHLAGSKLNTNIHVITRKDKGGGDLLLTGSWPTGPREPLQALRETRQTKLQFRESGPRAG